MRQAVVGTLAMPLVMVLLAASAIAAPEKSAELQELAKSLEGQQKWLRVDLVRIQYTLGGQNATKILPDGNVYYRAFTEGFRKTQSTSAEDFAEEARQKITDGTVRVLNKGVRVTIKEVKLGKDSVDIALKDEAGLASGVEFRFEKKDYSLDDVKKDLDIAFADEKSVATGSATTVNLQKGMSVDEVIKAKGNPISRADLDAKTVITYDDMKIVFEDGRLTDVQ